MLLHITFILIFVQHALIQCFGRMQCFFLFLLLKFNEECQTVLHHKRNISWRKILLWSFELYITAEVTDFFSININVFYNKKNYTGLRK